MNFTLLTQAVADLKNDLETAITTARFEGRQCDHGRDAKEALIRSQKLILKLHEVTKVSVSEVLQGAGRAHRVYPELGRSGPELKVSGFIKAKDQDVVVLFDTDAPTTEVITEGLLAGSTDSVGRAQSERSIVIGVRSQLSSVAKNFDTLMERAFAETLNLRLRLPRLVMGEVYMLPVKEYDEQLMLSNEIGWSNRRIPVEKFIRTFLGISGRTPDSTNDDLYKYERTALLLVDFQQNPPRIFQTLDELKAAGIVSADLDVAFDKLSPRNFADDLVAIHRERHR